MSDTIKSESTEIAKENMDDISKSPKFFKRNKKFLICYFPFLIVSIALLLLNVWAEIKLNHRFAYTTLLTSRGVFAVLYTIFMHIFWHKTNGKFSKHEVSDERILKKDKVINSVLLILPLVILLVWSVYSLCTIKYDFSSWYRGYNIRQTIDAFTIFNAILLNSLIIIMYFKNKLNFGISKESNKSSKKNKRLISYAFIWRFILIFGIAILFSNCLGDEITSLIASYKYDNYNSMVENGTMSFMTLSTMKLYDSIPGIIIGSIVYFLILIVGTIVINKIIKKKFIIEKQNERFVKRSMFVAVIMILICIISNIYYNAKDFFNINIMVEELNQRYESYLDMRDLAEQDILGPSSPNVIMSTDVVLKGFDVSKMADFYYKFQIPFIIYYLIGNLLVCVIIIKFTNKQISKSIIEDTVDEKGNIITTQDKLAVEYKKILITIFTFNIIIFTVLFLIYKVQSYEKPLHRSIKFTSYYTEVQLNNTDENNEISKDSGEEVDEEYLNWLKLEHEDSWYLENKISYTEALKYKNSHKEYNNDKEYIKSMEDEADELGKKIMQYKTLFDAEKALNIKFEHTSTFRWTYILDDKNYLTGIGVEVEVNDFTHRNIISYSLFDICQNLIKLKNEEKEEEMKNEAEIDNLNHKIWEIYADMSYDKLKRILGKPSSSTIDDKAGYEEYTWYDKLGNRLDITFRKKVIVDAYFRVVSNNSGSGDIQNSM